MTLGILFGICTLYFIIDRGKLQRGRNNDLIKSVFHCYDMFATLAGCSCLYSAGPAI